MSNALTSSPTSSPSRPAVRQARAWGATSATSPLAPTSIDRRDFGLTWNQVLETGGVMVGDRIDIAIEIEAVRQRATQAA